LLSCPNIALYNYNKPKAFKNNEAIKKKEAQNFQGKQIVYSCRQTQ